ncbi:hypothetical protein O3M35_007980 [Rhynocoris fuscipes]|uniref:Uncharacterized protein n=1 Tax=Rhynocoris fuscipes TaxID=488301 RepID=A0AAW1DDU0_9HEMI
MIIGRSTKWLAILLLIGICGSFIRRPLLESDGSDEYTLPYKGWLPFRVDTLPKCLVVWAYQAFTALSVVYGHFGFIVSFSIHANHLYTQFDMLSAFIDETFELDTIKVSNTEHYVRSRLKEAIKQHQLLTRCFELLQDLYNFPLLAMSMTSGLMFCTTIYMLTDPGSTMSMLASVSSFTLSECALIGLYCWFGQRVIDKWENIKDTIYNLDWYNQTRSTKTSLLLIMTMCTRDKVIKGGGLQEFSMKGFSELLQAGFSSFNMLQALR